MIAMALANSPKLLIADEPTTALDVTVQKQILELLQDLQQRLGMAMLFITHDLGIVRHMADAVCVMTAGEIVERGPTARIFAAPQHAYTRHLLAAEPAATLSARPRGPAGARSRASVQDLPDGRRHLHAGPQLRAVDDVSFTLRRGDAGPRRRIRLRQVDGGAHAASHRGEQRPGAVPRRGHHGDGPRALASAAACR